MSGFNFASLGLAERRWFSYPDTSRECSESLFNLIMDYHLSAASFHFIIGTVHSADESERRLTAALLDYVRDEDRRAKLRERLAEPHKNMKALNKYADLIERNLVNMLVDSFLWYIIGITKEVMLIKPEILRSGGRCCVSHA